MDDACDMDDFEVVGVGVTATGAVDVITMVVGGSGVPLLEEGVDTTAVVSICVVEDGAGIGVGVGVGVEG